ncbi:hypothetical protein [[Mycoplasma] gypis]|uniref:hypothetical protein n=1 Tax=[Mycoplasma] gypis TaxID=92404 RepID=UPI001968861F|nr:hypothetical protein [[Mycoplasma] gypis]MBN0919641.1 hypothetical protein [[Mycoplasma] gypis]
MFCNYYYGYFNLCVQGVFHFSMWRFIVLCFAIIIMGTSIYVFSHNNAVSDVLKKPGNHFKLVFQEFFNQYSNTEVKALPNQYSIGLIGAFYMAVTASIGSSVLSILIGVFALLFAIVAFFISQNAFDKISWSKAKRQKAKSVHNVTNYAKKPTYKKTKQVVPIIENNKPVGSVEIQKPVVNGVIKRNFDDQDELSDINSKENLNIEKIEKAEITKEISSEMETEENVIISDSPFDTKEFDVLDIVSIEPEKEKESELENTFNEEFYYEPQPQKSQEDNIEAKSDELADFDEYENEKSQETFTPEPNESTTTIEQENTKNNFYYSPSQKDSSESHTETKKRYVLVDDEEDLGLD